MVDITIALTAISVVAGTLWLWVLASTAGSMVRTFRHKEREHDTWRSLVFFIAAMLTFYNIWSFTSGTFVPRLGDGDVAVFASLRALSTLVAWYAIRVTRAHGAGS